MRLLTPASALITAVAIATASTGLVVKRSTDDHAPSRGIEALTDTRSAPEEAWSDATPSPEADRDAGASSSSPSAGPVSEPTAVGVGDERHPRATSLPSADPSTSPSPDPTTVIADDGVFIVDPDSGHVRPIFDRYVTDAVWLDDARIAFIRDAKMYIADADGSSQRQVFAGVVDGGMNKINLSPDRRWIAFVSGSSSSDDRPIYVTRSDGTGLRKIWTDTFNSTMGWSPDSLRLAFVAGGKDFGLRVNDIVTEKSTMLYGGFLDQPTWTPDGTRIVFFNGAIMKINAVTGDYQTLAQQTDFAPTPILVDADGSHVYYHNGHAEDWWSVGIDGGTPQNIGSGSLPFLWARSHGRAVIIERTGEQDCDFRWITRLVIADADLSGRRTLVLAGTYTTLYGVHWSPHGQKLLVRTSLFKTPRKCV